MNYSIATIEYEPIKNRAARLLVERQDTVSDIRAQFGAEADDWNELAFVKEMRRTFMSDWTDEQRSYLLGLIEAEDEIIEGSYR